MTIDLNEIITIEGKTRTIQENKTLSRSIRYIGAWIMGGNWKMLSQKDHV